MVSSCVLISVIVAFGMIANSRGEDQSQINHVDKVVEHVIAGPEGDYTITVTGGLQWKEIISVKKTGTKKYQRINNMESYFSENCCDVPSNITDNKTIIVLVQCVNQTKEVLGEDILEDQRPESQLKAVNCILQCTSHRLGLSYLSGSIISERMADFVENDSRETTIGISRDMINKCIGIAKNNGPAILEPNEGGNVCNTSSFEALKFVKCLTELGNLYCPGNYRKHSKSCERSRQDMKKKLRTKY